MTDHRLSLTRQWLRKHGLLSARRPSQPRRIGVYAGAFDPVHAGHIGFALQALEAARLDQIVFLPERIPPQKPGVEHYAHRVGMLKRALRPHPRLAVMEMVDRNYTVARTLPQLQALFQDDKLILLMGSDTAARMPKWKHVGRLLRQTELAIGVSAGSTADDVRDMISGWSAAPQGVTVIDSFAPDISSAAIRQALRSGQTARGLLASVRDYATREWLYVSVK